MSLGRNDLCPCGSGKKYKKCCLISEGSKQTEDLTHRRFREIERVQVGRLFEYAANVFGPSAIDEAWDEFFLWNFDEEYSHESPFTQIFGPFYLFSWTIDPVETSSDLALKGKTIAESYLDQYRKSLSADEIKFLEAANSCVFTFYEITEIFPEHGFQVRDILTGNCFDVREKDGSRGVKRGSIIFGALFHIEGTCQTLAVSPYPLPPKLLGRLIELRKNLQKRCKTKALTSKNISDFTLEIREVYLDLLDVLLNPAPPTLCNTDGEPLLPQTLHFHVTSPGKAFSALKFLTGGFVTEENLLGEAKMEHGEIVEVEIPWFKAGKTKGKNLSNTVLGRIKISGNKLTVEVNSDKRADVIAKKIEKALGKDVRFVTKVIESVEGNIDRADGGMEATMPLPLDKLPPDAFDAVKHLAKEYWANWFNDKIPALGNKTPRQAAKSQEGRELLEALLSSYESSATPMDVAANLFQPDVKRLREELGLK